MLSNQDIQVFQALYKKHFDIELDDKEAYEKAMKLIRFVDVVYREYCGYQEDNTAGIHHIDEM